jgi:UDP-glucose:(heptosyl)LPS alpha-1,3-glucosyltransferase
MKLAFCLFKYYPHGGLTRDFLRIVEVCQRRGYSIDIFTMKWDHAPKHLNVIQIPYRGLTNHRRCASFVKNLFSTIKIDEYDLVIGFNRMPGLDIYYAADLCYKYIVEQRHSAIYHLTNRYKTYVAFENAVFSPNSKTHIMYLAEMVKQQYIKYYHTPKGRFHLLSPGISKDFMAPSNAEQIRSKLRQKFHIQEQQKLILLIGSNYFLKGVDRVLLALAALPKNLRKNTLLWIIGKGKDHFYKWRAKRLGVTANVKFLGLQDNISELLLAADLLIHPARFEAAGMVLLEAIASGIPVLTTDTCGFAFHILRAKAGLVITSPFEQENLNNCLIEMLTSKHYQEWKKNALSYANTENLYSRSEAADIIESLVSCNEKFLQRDL